MDNKDRYIFVLVHADIWGAINANKLVKAIAEYHDDQGGLKPILFVSNSTRNKKTGKIAVGENPDLLPIREIKEERLAEFFKAVDGLTPPEHCQMHEPELLTFNALARKYCADHEPHIIASGGPSGGTQMLEIFQEFRKKGIVPEIVLSGDTLAFVPKEVINEYPCFGTHPGPLPQVPGMHATLRSVLHRQFFTKDGVPDSFSGYQRPRGMPHVAGTLFNLHENLDEGPPLDFVYTPYIPGMSMIDLRESVYDKLTDKMIERLPTLLDPMKRTELIAEKTIEHEKRRKKFPHPVPPLDGKTLQKMIPAADAKVLAQSLGHSSEDEKNFITQLLDSDRYATAVPAIGEDGKAKLEVLRPGYIRPSWFKNTLATFWPECSPEMDPTEFNRLHSNSNTSLSQEEIITAAIRLGREAKAATEAANHANELFGKTFDALFPDLDRYVNDTFESHRVKSRKNSDGSSYPHVTRHIKTRSSASKTGKE